MVQAHSVYFHAFTIEREAFRGIEFKTAQSGAREILVKRPPFFVGHGAAHRVKVRRACAPKLRRGYFKQLRCRSRRPGRDIQHGVLRGHADTSGRKNRCGEPHFACARQGVFHVRVHLYKCAGGINFRCAHESAPLRHMHGSELAQPHIAVNPATAVPARVGLLGIVDTHGNDIPAFVQPRSEVVAERRVAIGARAETMTVDIDRGIHVGSVEVHINTLFKVGGCDVKAFTIPAYASGECTSACAAGVVDAEIALDGPIVRQRESAPLRIVECCLLRPGHFAKMEAPACVEALGTAVGTAQRHRYGQDSQQQNAYPDGKFSMSVYSLFHVIILFNRKSK